MTADILRALSAAGVCLTIGDDGKLKGAGNQSTLDQWLPEIRANKHSLVALLRERNRPSWRWLVMHPDGTVSDHTVTPPETLAEIRRAYPECIAFEPLFDRTPAFFGPGANSAVSSPSAA